MSPSTGRPETPGPIDGWATDVARRHAATLLARLTGEPDPHPGIEEELYTVARNEGQDAAQEFIRIVAGIAWDAAPASWKQAVLRGAADRHLGPIHRQATAAMPLLLGAGLLFALGRRK